MATACTLLAFWFEMGLMFAIAPLTAAEVAGHANLVPTLTPCPYTGPAAGDACAAAESLATPVCRYGDPQQIASACSAAPNAGENDPCAQSSNNAASVDACQRQQAYVMYEVERAVQAQRNVCAGYDPSLPAPDQCPPGTPIPTTVVCRAPRDLCPPGAVIDQ